MYENALKDCLNNLSLSENLNTTLTYRNRKYYQGLIVGIVSALRFKGHSFHMAITILEDNLPDDCVDLTDGILPEGWDKEFKSLGGK